MLWLAGLMGMMMLGSIAVISTQEGEEDRDEDVEGGDAVPDDPLPEEAASGVAGDADAPGGLVLDGSDGAETLTGTPMTDLLGGAGGDDLVQGLGADDELLGGAGADTMLGGDGNDTLHGDDGDDLLSGGAGDDALFAHAGADTLLGDDGDDVLNGGSGGEFLDGGDGDDALHGREGDDTLFGGTGSDTLMGGAGDDVLSGIEDGVTDYLNAGDGADSLLVGAGDVATGGAGADDFLMSLSSSSGGEAATLMDFDAVEDQVVVVYDDRSGAVPEVELRDSPTEPGMMELLVDGEVLAVMPGAEAPDPGDIVLIGESVAGEMIAVG